MKANFPKDSYWTTLTYKKGTRKCIEEVKKDYRKFVDKLRKKYKARGYPLKWMRVIEIGKYGGVHLHVVFNRIDGADAMIAECWPHGHPHIELTYEDEDYTQLASYMAKLPEEKEDKTAIEQLEKLDKSYYDYSTSRNLIRPKPERKTYFRRTVEKMIKDGPKPTAGYYIVKESVRQGVNRLTGYSYLRYTEAKINRIRGDDG